MKKDNNEFEEIALKLKECSLLLKKFYSKDFKVELNVPSSKEIKMNITEYNI